MNKASKAMRLFFFNVGVLMLVGIGLTGFTSVHWFLYVVPAFMLFAAVTGLCPGMIITRKLVGEA